MSYLQACNGTTTKNKRCKKIAGADGFCHLHKEVKQFSNEILNNEENIETTKVDSIPVRLKVRGTTLSVSIITLLLYASLS